MSVVPLRISDQVKVSKPRDPPGTVNIPYGYRLSQHGQTRPNVNLTSEKQSHLTEGDTPSRAKYPSNQDRRESPNKTDRTENEKGGTKNGVSMRANDASKNEKYSSIREKGKSLGRANHSKKGDNQISILPGQSTVAYSPQNAREERDYKSFLRTWDFEKRTDSKIQRHKFRTLVDEGLTEYEQSINVRREKLRLVILAEEKELIREIIDQAARGAVLREDEMRKRTEELRKCVEEQRRATVTEKRMQQYLDQCPEVRNKFTKKRTLETKYSNLVQMAENEAKREAEKEVDTLWYELMLKEVEAKKARELEEERRRMATGKSIVATLEKQIAGKLALCEEEKRVKEEESENLDKFWGNVGKEESSDPAIQREKRAKLKRDLEEQLLTAKRFLAERAREEEAVEHTIRVLSEAELSRERAMAKESTSRLRGEIAAYMGSLEKVRNEEAERNAEVEAIVAASTREVEIKRDLAKKKAREERGRLLREVLEGREQQLRAKRASEEEENKRAALEEESRLKKTEVDALLEAEAETRRRQNAVRYGQELKAQQKYAAEMERQEDEKAERMHRDDLEREKKYEKLAEQMLNAPEIITPHAFKILLKECAARREAAQNVLCYSSRSST